MNIITTRGVIGLLVNQVGIAKAKDFAEQCLQIAMVESHSPERNMAISTLNSNLPPFEVQYHFIFKLDGKHEALFEILGKDGFILQAGYQVVFPTMFIFPSKGENKYRDAMQVLENHYGTGLPMAQQDIEIMNYGNATTVSYVSLMKMKRAQSLTVRVGNRHFWK
ncbi:MAG: hypothetical protein L6455_13855 [Kiritimatiellae bacterium]|nr:hypothetical protein [Kiritimatiellia bacterium]